MNNHVHPVFAGILNSMTSKKEPVTPPTPKGSHEFVFATDLGDVICWMDHIRGEPQTRDDPGCDEALILTHAWIKDIDVFERLDEDVCEAIEEAARCQMSDERKMNEDEHLINRRYG